MSIREINYSESKLFNRIHTRLFENIIKGNFKPYSETYNNPKSLNNLFEEAQSLKLIFNTEILMKLKENIPDMREFGFKSDDHFTYTINNENKQGKWYIILIPLKRYKCCEKLCISEYDSIKTKEYTLLICDEFERIKIKAIYVLEKLENKTQLYLYATKNITKAKKLHIDALNLISNLKVENKTDSIYILYVLDLFIIKTIIFFQETFKHFIDNICVSENELKIELSDTVFASHSGFITGNWNEKKSLPCTASISEDVISEIPTSNEKTFFTESQTYLKHRWNGQINVLVDIFLQLTETFTIDEMPVLSMDYTELHQFLLANFTDKKGNDLSDYTIKTLLKPNRHDKKIHPDSPKRINLSEFFTPKKSPNS